VENLAVTFVDLGLEHVSRLEVGLNRMKAVQRVPKSVENMGKLFFGIEPFGCFQDLINGYGTDQVVKATRSFSHRTRFATNPRQTGSCNFGALIWDNSTLAGLSFWSAASLAEIERKGDMTKNQQ
jgi:hypothetical protein